MLLDRVWFSFFCSISIVACIGTLSNAADTLTRNQTIGDGYSLASLGGTFELGFFSRGASKNKYLGIWYKNSPDTIVWIANRDNPISDLGGSLMFDGTGNLVILNQTKSVIWSSNVTQTVADPVAQLLDTGNLALKGSGNSTSLGSNDYIWQSFEHPTDTLLPGMKIGWNLKTGRETYLTSWKGEDDPSSGTFTFRLDIQGLPQLVLASGHVEKYRTGPWKGSFFDGLPLVDNHPLFKLTVIANAEEIYHTYEPRNSSITTRIAMNESGLVQRYIKYNANDGWSGIFWTPFDVCDNYAQCGVNGVCSTSNSAPCQCLKGFISNAAPGNLDATSWTSTTGCKRKMALNCDKGEGFVQIVGVKLPDMIHSTWSQSLDPLQCEADCRSNCTCAAYANLNISGQGKGCMMWFGDLFDVKKQLLGSQDLYIRVAASELELLNSQGKKRNIGTILAASIGSVCGVLLFSSIIWFTWSRRKSKGRSRSAQDDGEVPLFDFHTISAATDGFSEANILGVGGFGSVYKGKLLSGQDIAVKRLSDNSSQGVEEFRNEVTLIAKLQHRNLVSLIGSCIRGDERMLIYEYLPNGSLDYFLFGNRTEILPWKERFNIILGIARGMLYLHQDSKLHVVHRDLKASNILLDSNLNPKISDFGLARIFGDDDNQARTKRVVGTYGYMSPEYAIDGRFSVKSDVFSFGVLLLEIVSSKRNRGFAHSDHYHSLLGHSWLLWAEGRPLDLVDRNLDQVYSTSQVVRCIHVGLLCVQKFPEDRPDMSSVVFMLANEEVALPQSKQPGFFTERSFPATSSPVRDQQSHSASHYTFTMPEVR